MLELCCQMERFFRSKRSYFKMCAKNGHTLTFSMILLLSNLSVSLSDSEYVWRAGTAEFQSRLYHTDSLHVTAMSNMAQTLRSMP